MAQYTSGRSTVPLRKSSWSSPKTFRFRKFWKLYLLVDENLLRITNPVLDLTGDQYFYVIFRSCDSKNHYTNFKFVWEIEKSVLIFEKKGLC